MTEKNKSTDRTDYSSPIPEIGHTGDQYIFGVDGEDLSGHEHSFLREVEERQRQAELDEAG